VKQRAAGFLVAGVVVLLGTAPSFAATPTDCRTLTYVNGIETVASQLAANPPEISAARTMLNGLQHTFATSAPVLTPILDDLSAAPPDVADATARLTAMRRVLAVPAGATCKEDTAAASKALHDVYASPVFAHLDRPAQPSLLEQLLNFVSQLFDRLTRSLGAAGSLAVGGAVLLLAAAFAWRRMHDVLGKRERRIAAEPVGESDDPDDEWGAATAAAARGDHREAVRRAFRSALLDIAIRGALHVDPAWTTRELLANVASDADLVAALAPAAASFDYAWYSGRAVGAEQWQQARARCEALRTMARRRRIVAA
jgi:hypothetical protein